MAIRTKTTRMCWDASMIRVHDSKEAIAKAKRLGKPAPSDKKQTAKTTVLDMIQRKGGASLEEIIAVTGWQPHTVRGFISTAPRKAGLDVTSSKVEGRGRVYEAR